MAFYYPYLQPMPGLGTSNRNAGAVILGGPRAGAGSSSRIYNFLSKFYTLTQILRQSGAIKNARKYNNNSFNRNKFFSI
jgi:hypothetical protein